MIIEPRGSSTMLQKDHHADILSSKGLMPGDFGDLSLRNSSALRVL